MSTSLLLAAERSSGGKLGEILGLILGWVAAVVVLGYIAYFLICAVEKGNEHPSAHGARTNVALILPFIVMGVQLGMTHASYGSIKDELTSIPDGLGFIAGLIIGLIVCLTAASLIVQDRIVYTTLVLASVEAIFAFCIIQGLGSHLYPIMYGAVVVGGIYFLIKGPPPYG